MYHGCSGCCGVLLDPLDPFFRLRISSCQRLSVPLKSNRCILLRRISVQETFSHNVISCCERTSFLGIERTCSIKIPPKSFCPIALSSVSFAKAFADHTMTLGGISIFSSSFLEPRKGAFLVLCRSSTAVKAFASLEHCGPLSLFRCLFVQRKGLIDVDLHCQSSRKAISKTFYGISLIQLSRTLVPAYSSAFLFIGLSWSDSAVQHRQSCPGQCRNMTHPSRSLIPFESSYLVLPYNYSLFVARPDLKKSFCAPSDLIKCTNAFCLSTSTPVPAR